MWKEEIWQRYPELIELSKVEETISEKSIAVFLKSVHVEQENVIRKVVENLQLAWAQTGENFLKTLTNVIETQWPQNKKIIALISVLPVCPRDLARWTFFVDGCVSTKTALSIMDHEICHLLYFKKWQEVFLGSKRETFEYPYLEWHLSEILAPVILGDPRIQDFLQKEPGFYEEHKQLKIDGTSVPDHFKRLYSQHLTNQSSFEHFLKCAYREVKKIGRELLV